MNDGGYWDRVAPSYDRSMWLLGGPLPRLCALAARSVQDCSRVLEVAAGTGLVTRALAGAAREVLATDGSPSMVERLRARVQAEGLGNVRCETADLLALPYEAASFDAVVAANVLHLVDDLPTALASLRRVLAPGGALVVPTFAHAQTRLARLGSRALSLTGFPGRRRLDVRSLAAAVEAAGVRVERAEVIPGLVPVAFVVGRA